MKLLFSCIVSDRVNGDQYEKKRGERSRALDGAIFGRSIGGFIK